MTIIDTFWFKKSQLFLYFPLNTFISQDLLLKYFFFHGPPPPHWTVNFPIKSRGQSNPLEILGSILHTEIKERNHSLPEHLFLFQIKKDDISNFDRPVLEAQVELGNVLGHF